MPASTELPPSVRVVDSFEALLSAAFEGACNAVVWRRALPGDFGGLVRRLPSVEGVTAIDEAALAALPTRGAVTEAAAAVLADLRRLRAAGQAPELDVVERYPRDDDEVLSTDVHSFHVDTADAPTDTYLCCYSGAPSEGLEVAEAERAIDVPSVRAALLARFGGRDDEAFAAYLASGHFDLHYRPRPGARAYSMGVGHLWRLAVRYPGSPVQACIHRAPLTGPGDPPRLLLIS